jgi:uncharacterized protein (DUF1015 family)
MDLVRPFRALRPADGRAADIAAPPYDVLNSAEARERAAGRPDSFLHISKPEIDLPEGTDVYAPQVYEKAAENLARMIESGALVRDEKPCYYVYRATMGNHVQTGIAGVASVAEYNVNRVRKHEFTRPQKEDDRVRHMESLNAQTGPVMVAHRPHDAIARVVAETTTGEPACDLSADDGVGHTIWVISDDDAIATITRAFDAMPAIYIADGHHRSASASRVASARGANDDPDASAAWFMIVSFPTDEMQILDYNRVVTDLNGQSPRALLAALVDAFEVHESAEPVSPDRPGVFGLYADGHWHRLVIREDRVPTDPVESLDVSLLQTHLIGPLLGIRDQRTDNRIDFVGGIRGLEELERRVDSGEMALAVSLYPTSIDALIAVADAGEVMPPKSTWFEPKLADGLMSHVLD